MGLFIKKEKVLMGLRKYSEGNLWTFPGGKVEKNDKSLKDAIIREVFEETGIMKEFYSINEMVYEKNAISRKGVVYYFLCNLIDIIDVNFEYSLENGKFLKWQWFSVDQIPHNIIDKNDIILLKSILH